MARQVQVFLTARVHTTAASEQEFSLFLWDYLLNFFFFPVEANFLRAVAAAACDLH